MVKFRSPAARTISSSRADDAERRRSPDPSPTATLRCRHDVSERHQEPYIVIDHAGGGSLDCWISAGGPRLPVGQAVHWAGEPTRALAYLHQLAIIRRDCKPGTTDDLQLKLADFGVATSCDGGGDTCPHRPKGTPSVSARAGHWAHGRPAVGHQRVGRRQVRLFTGHVPYRRTKPARDDFASDRHSGPNSQTSAATCRRGWKPSSSTPCASIPSTATRPPSPSSTTTAWTAAIQQKIDRAPESPMGGAIGWVEGPAIAHLVLDVAGEFLAIVVILLSIALR